MSPKSTNIPFVLDKDLGRPQLPSSDAYCRTNADGKAIVELSPSQKYAFDLRGWLLVPGVLSEEETLPIREHIKQLHTAPFSIPEKDRSPLGGPCERLIDHPIVVGFMNEFVYNPFTDGEKSGPIGNQHCYGFRLDSSNSQYRPAEDERSDIPNKGKFLPHNGSGMMRLPGDHHTYHAFPGQAKSILTRAIWELNPVKKGEGGTLFISGSHKAAFATPEEAIIDIQSSFWESYSCPAGSVLFFTEAVTHSASRWINAEAPRAAILNLYNMVGCRWSDWDPHPELLAQMPSQRQTLFRPVYVNRNVTDK